MPLFKEYSDSELVSLLKEDSQAAFTEIYERFSDDVYLTAHKILLDEDISLDIVQDIFEWLWINRFSVEIRTLKSYLVTAARFKVLNVLKKGNFQENVISRLSLNSVHLNSCELAYEVKELQEVIRQFTMSLPDQARKIFHMSRTECLTNREIADQLGLSEKTIKKQINITLRKLRMRLGKNAFLLGLFF